MKYQRQIDVEIPALANGVPGLVNLRVSGRIVTCTTATAAYKIARDGGRKIDMSAGRSDGDSDSPEFGTLSFYNSTNNVIQTTLIASDEPYVPDRTVSVSSTSIASSKNAQTYNKFTTLVLVNAIPVVFSGLNGADRRKSFSAFNAAALATAGAVIQLADGNGVYGEEIDQRQSKGWDSGGTFQVVNNSGVYPITVRVVEVFYSA